MIVSFGALPHSEIDFLKEARQIGDDLLTRASVEVNAMHWDTMQATANGDVEWVQTQSLYGGVAGISLFLLTLFEVTGEERFLDASVKGMCWVERRVGRIKRGAEGFFSGDLGISYVFLRLFESTKEVCFLDSAISIADRFVAEDQPDWPWDDVMRGSAGTILGLLHLLAVTGEGRFASAIRRKVDGLVRRAKILPSGVSWDHCRHHIKGLCGLAHGAGGIGLVMTELAAYSKVDQYEWLANQAFSYEDALYSTIAGNWPDFRTPVISSEGLEAAKEEYIKGNIDAVTVPSDMNAWCHGAVGVGLVRLRAWEITSDRRFLVCIRRSLQKTVHSSLLQLPGNRPHTLCHGLSGDAELFLECSQILEKKEYAVHARSLAARILEARTKNGWFQSGIRGSSREDPSLFNGTAGIGYFFLRMHDPSSVRSICLPKVVMNSSLVATPRTALSVNLTPSDIRENLLTSVFPRTLKVVRSRDRATGMSDFLHSRLESIGDEVYRFNETVRLISLAECSSIREHLLEINSHEMRIWQLGLSVQSAALLYVQEKVRSDAAFEACSHGWVGLEETVLRLVEGCLLIETEWNWSQSIDGLVRKCDADGRDRHFLLLRTTSAGTMEDSLNWPTYCILKLFTEPRTTKDAVDEFVKGNVIVSGDLQSIRALIIRQIEEAILGCILEIVQADRPLSIVKESDDKCGTSTAQIF